VTTQRAETTDLTHKRKIRVSCGSPRAHPILPSRTLTRGGTERHAPARDFVTHDRGSGLFHGSGLELADVL